MTVAHRLRTLAAAVTAVVAPLALAPAALADTATPENPVGPASHAIDNIYRAVIGTTMVIFILVGGWLVYSAIRFRARPGRPVDPPQVHGSSRLEWGWTIVPVLILVGLAGYTFHKLPDVKDAPSDALVVNVVAQQFQFSYTYGANAGAAEGKAPSDAATLVVPENTAVKLEVRAKDVDHDWWVPSLGPKVDAIPGPDDHHLVSGRPHRDVPRAVRGVLRRRPRHDADHGEGRVCGRLAELRGRAEVRRVW